MLRFIRSFLNSRGEFLGELRGDCLEFGDPHGEFADDLGFSLIGWGPELNELSSWDVSLMVLRHPDVQCRLKLLGVQSPKLICLHLLLKGSMKGQTKVWEWSKGLPILGPEQFHLTQGSCWANLTDTDTSVVHRLPSSSSSVYITGVPSLPLPKYGWMNYWGLASSMTGESGVRRGKAEEMGDRGIGKMWRGGDMEAHRGPISQRKRKEKSLLYNHFLSQPICV